MQKRWCPPLLPRLPLTLSLVLLHCILYCVTWCARVCGTAHRTETEDPALRRSGPAEVADTCNMPLIDSALVSVGLGVAKVSTAVWGLNKVSQYEAINGFPTDPNGKPYNTPYRIPGHMNLFPEQWAKYRDHHKLKPKYHAVPPGTSLTQGLSYTPHQLSVRKDKAALDAEGHPTYNGVCTRAPATSLLHLHHTHPTPRHAARWRCATAASNLRRRRHGQRTC